MPVLRPLRTRLSRWCPSTTLRVVPLPVPGRNLARFLPGTGRGTMRSMVAGHAPQTRQAFDPLGADLDDPGDGGVEVAQDRHGRHAHGRDLLRSQEFRAACVRPRGSLAIVRASVDLDRQPSYRAVEVEDVDSGRVLAPEFQALGAFAQLTPEEALGQGHLAAELARAFHHLARSGYHDGSPPPPCGWSPSPFRGGTIRGSRSCGWRDWSGSDRTHHMFG